MLWYEKQLRSVGLYYTVKGKNRTWNVPVLGWHPFRGLYPQQASTPFASGLYVLTAMPCLACFLLHSAHSQDIVRRGEILLIYRVTEGESDGDVFLQRPFARE
jgi:hypothetical protein